MMAGQFDILAMPYYRKTEPNGHYHEFIEKLNELKLLAFPELGLHQNYGIANNETPDVALYRG